MFLALAARSRRTKEYNRNLPMYNLTMTMLRLFNNMHRLADTIQ